MRENVQLCWLEQERAQSTAIVAIAYSRAAELPAQIQQPVALETFIVRFGLDSTAPPTLPSETPSTIAQFRKASPYKPHNKRFFSIQHSIVKILSPICSWLLSSLTTMARLALMLAFLAVSLNHALLTVSRPAGIKETKSLARRYSGKGTWFIPDTGACGDTNSKSDYIVAMNYAQYNNGSPCHKVVVIKNKANNKVVKAKVTDECPGCPYGSLDLSPAAFKALGNLDTGVLPISWDWA
ncbi:hypothetical protein MJO28_001506 [Puccinia striiformis f. sp. tritici]|uniref:Uncharacterized protein n=1 Tax=Puccinia striiformis f. sp. tritici TaxID=168172 RepID=A0ACC0EUJ8_9BASI|nr:hypothetical protein MJO28_001506 [Puccinia striiformis f. sp. tritici]